MGLGPIPWMACYQYGLAHRLDDDMLTVFPRIIMRMDEAYLDWTAREMERKSGAATKGKQQQQTPKPGVEKVPKS